MSHLLSREEGDGLDVDVAVDAQCVHQVQLQTVLVLQQMVPVHRHLDGRQTGHMRLLHTTLLATLFLKRGLKWKAMSARGFTLLPHWKSTWNLEHSTGSDVIMLMRVQFSTPLHCTAKLRHLSASWSTTPWISTISPGARPPRMVPAKGMKYIEGIGNKHLMLVVVLTSSLLISSLEKVRPGMSPLFFSQKMAAKDPEKKMPSTAANATTRSPGGGGGGEGDHQSM
ncbi:hypothetical protein CRUP_027968 [Coryphaenoides rupestris]|nr:hypothetical protein CRUP_027968 [Coryphaenoides rupestris]